MIKLYVYVNIYIYSPLNSATFSAIFCQRWVEFVQIQLPRNWHFLLYKREYIYMFYLKFQMGIIVVIEKWWSVWKIILKIRHIFAQCFWKVHHFVINRVEEEMSHISPVSKGGSYRNITHNNCTPWWGGGNNITILWYIFTIIKYVVTGFACTATY